ncbi:hypothetical protein QC763_116320 [Podospora pseudopauciseta]|uniref:Uncharacterized protein n=1 Tax=Podospora pseudopauciseta TaxID=2093780 RepID=A0ABR0I128_9PEZI|nr:hypothetical protein QC763_116320 [Podospora pseudopauciseta]
MAANETTPLLRESNTEGGTPARATDAETQQTQNEDQLNLRGPTELKLAAVAHLGSVVTSFGAVGLALVYGPLVHNPPKSWWPPYVVRELASTATTVGILTVIWGLANFLVFHFRRRLIGPPFLGGLLHLMGAFPIFLFFMALNDIMERDGGSHQCQRWDGQQWYPADPECLAWVKRFFVLVYTGLFFFLGVCTSHAVLVYLNFMWTKRQFVAFMRSLPWSRPELSSHNGAYRARVPVPIVPIGGISFEFGIKVLGRDSVPRSAVEAEENSSAQATTSGQTA